ncbi:MAG: antibiotic biosynthesis monooxygenase [Myxococcales bacterium]|jgi:quinol monooxygenase YgiN
MTPTHFIIHTISLKPGTIDAAKALFEDKVPPLAERFDGWCGARLSFDRENDQAVTIGAWADAAQMQEFLAQPELASAMEAFSQYFAAPPQTTITEVVSEVGPRA